MKKLLFGALAMAVLAGCGANQSPLASSAFKASGIEASGASSGEKTVSSMLKQVEQVSGKLAGTSDGMASIGRYLERKIKSSDSSEAKKASDMLDEAFKPAAKEYTAALIKLNDTVLKIEGNLVVKIHGGDGKRPGGPVERWTVNPADSLEKQAKTVAGNLAYTAESLRSNGSFLEMQLKAQPYGGIDAKKAKELLEKAFTPALKEYLDVLSEGNEKIVGIEKKLTTKVFPE